MDAVVIAGGIPQPNEKLYIHSRGHAKALVDVAGKPMVQWVLDALSEAHTIEHVVLIGLTDRANLTCKKPITYLSNKGKLLENIKAGTSKVLELNPKTKYVLFVSSDIPGIKGEMVDWVVNNCLETSDDLYYNVIRREDMEERFPTSKRTYWHLKDMQVCGGDMNVGRASIVFQNPEFWSKLIETRKKPISQVNLIGWDMGIKFMLRQLTIDDIVQRVADKLGLKGRALVCPYPEVGMDVDKPHQLEIMRADLSKRPRRSTSTRVSTSKKKTVRKPVAKAKSKAKPAGKPVAKVKARPAKKVAAKSKHKSKKK
jgi:molybdopterin-guanine dinucleotide biosynthesis protein A